MVLGCKLSNTTGVVGSITSPVDELTKAYSVLGAGEATVTFLVPGLVPPPYVGAPDITGTNTSAGALFVATADILPAAVVSVSSTSYTLYLLPTGRAVNLPVPSAEPLLLASMLPARSVSIYLLLSLGPLTLMVPSPSLPVPASSTGAMYTPGLGSTPLNNATYTNFAFPSFATGVLDTFIVAGKAPEPGTPVPVVTLEIGLPLSSATNHPSNW